MTKFWLGVVSEQHVGLGVKGGFAMVCHGKKGPLSKMKKGDWLVYYSPKTSYPEGEVLKAFTAIGQMVDDQVYQVEMRPDFCPFRRDVSYLPCKKVFIDEIKHLLDFTANARGWGIQLRRGHLELSKGDFSIIAERMQVSIDECVL